MTAWIIRAGRGGEREQWALDNAVSGGGWHEVPDLSGCSSRDEVFDLVSKAYPEMKVAGHRNFAAQLWVLRGRVQVGDLILMPLKTSGTKLIAVGRCTKGYQYLPSEDPTRRHVIGVEWLRTDVPRSSLKQDLLFSLGAFMTVCEIRRNNAEARIEAVLAGGIDPGADVPALKGRSLPIDIGTDEFADETIEVDIETVARDGIRIRLIETFQSHQLAELTAAILKARGLTCVVSPPGPDKGIDIIAGAGPLGLDSPRIVVQCKSGDAAVDISVIQRLQGAMSTTGAEQALLVAFGGVNKAARDILTNQQFKLKVWDADGLVDAVLDTYALLEEDVRAMLPLKSVWMFAGSED